MQEKRPNVITLTEDQRVFVYTIRNFVVDGKGILPEISLHNLNLARAVLASLKAQEKNIFKGRGVNKKRDRFTELGDRIEKLIGDIPKTEIEEVMEEDAQRRGKRDWAELTESLEHGHPLN